MKNFAENLKYFLEKKNISQSELARNTNLSRSAISHYLNGTNEPTFNNLLAISRFLKISPEYLVGECIHENPNDISELIDTLTQLTELKKIKWSIGYSYAEPVNSLEGYEQTHYTCTSEGTTYFVNTFNNKIEFSILEKIKDGGQLQVKITDNDERAFNLKYLLQAILNEQFDEKYIKKNLDKLKNLLKED